jgi:hypothetical protein
MIIRLADGWYDESSEGPYTEILHTKDDWRLWRLHLPHRSCEQYHLQNLEAEFSFETIEEAKEYVQSRQLDDQA